MIGRAPSAVGARRAFISSRGVLGWLLCVVGVMGSAGPAFGREVIRFEHLTMADGLAQDTVNDLAQDHEGFVWIATSDGLCRYDGHSLVTYLRDRSDPRSLPHNDVRDLLVDGDGRLWLATRGGGLARYEPRRDDFTVWRADPENPEGLSTDYLTELAMAPDGRLWIGTRTDGLAILDPETGHFSRHEAGDEPGMLRDHTVYAIHHAADGSVWIGTRHGGLHRFVEGRFEHFSATDGRSGIPSNLIRAIEPAAGDELWLATGGGLVRWDPHGMVATPMGAASGGPAVLDRGIRDLLALDGQTMWLSVPGLGVVELHLEQETFRVFGHEDTRPESLASSATSALMRDATGVLWVGTYGGVDRHDPATRRFTSHRADLGEGAAFADDDLWGIQQHSDGSIWLATDAAGVVRYEPQADAWTSWRHDPDDPASLAADDPQYLLVDSRDRVWVGFGDHGLDRHDATRDAWLHHRNDPADPTSLPNDNVFSISEAADGRIWLGLDRGYAVLDPRTGRFRHISLERPGDPLESTTFHVVEAPDGRLWTASFLDGLNVLDLSSDTPRWTSYFPDPEDPATLPTRKVHVLWIDDDGTVWAGTDLGLFELVAEGETWRHYGVPHGLSNESILSLQRDPDGALWVGTANGLCRLGDTPDRTSCFFAGDGLPASEMAWHALTTLDDGRLAIGTAAGFALLDRARLMPDPTPPVVLLSGFELFNRPVRLRHRLDDDEKDRFSLPRPIRFLDELELSHRESLVTFELAALHFAHPGEHRFAYRLLGHDDDWLETSAQRPFATYSNLPPGSYNLELKAANHDGVWSEPETALVLAVRPAPWRSPLAWTSYVALLLGALAAFATVLVRRAAYERERAEHEAGVNRQLRRLDELKDEFLANTSHELRTPLHGMVGIAESLVDGAGGPLPEEVVNNLRMVVSSGRRLSALVDDILDFSKVRHRELDLRLRPIGLRSIADVVLALHQPMVGSRPVDLINRIAVDLPLAMADEDRVQQILHNLVGNAIKFTEAGEVVVGARDEGERLAVWVADTGVGIAAEDHERIFASFEQVEGASDRVHGGVGLGLAVTRQLVELHGGSVSVDSSPGAGATFTFTLDKAVGDSLHEEPRVPEGDARLCRRPEEGAEVQVPRRRAGDPKTGSGFTVLVVDDEPINRQLLVNHLRSQRHHTIDAADGETALRLVEESRPDLVLLDIMMPRLSGYDVCRRLRAERSASDLPVIFLSARTRVSDLVVGFEAGANDYVSKPFSRAELVARVDTHLELLDVHRNLEARVVRRTEELHLANQELERLASLDGLTQIPNRRVFDRELEAAWRDHAERARPLALLLCDLDHFKGFNDHYGHQQGDAVLVTVAQTIAGALRRAGDLAARYGGEELAVVLPDTELAAACELAAELVGLVRGRHIEHRPNPVADVVTVSIGVAAMVPTADRNPAQLVERADQALYRAKEEGRDRWVAHPPSGTATSST